MKNVVSFLLGSGFSVAEKLPTVSQLNARLSRISQEEIEIHSSMSAWFLNGEKGQSGKKDEKAFVQEFLEFYNSHILCGKDFNYEDFFDFYSLYLKDGSNNDIITSFCSKFEEKHSSGKSTFNPTSRVSYFNRTFNQLLAQLLSRPRFLDENYISGYSKYQGFVLFLQEILSKYDVKVHTLNHDLFFDWLGSNEIGLYQHFCNGFELHGSPYYGTLYETKNTNEGIVQTKKIVKLPHYTGKFNKALALYKLHGSINNYIVSEGNCLDRIHKLSGIFDIIKEKWDGANNDYEFVGVWDDVMPNFLSGTVYKTTFYNNDPYYKSLFESFEENLLKSELLYVIGYGFQDFGVNEYIERAYLSKGKKMVVVEPNGISQELQSFFEKYNVSIETARVEKIEYEQFSKYINPQHQS